MSPVSPSSSTSRYKSGELEPEDFPWSKRVRPASRGMIENEFASTGREWAIKPPPGMESEPFDWDVIIKL